MVNRRCFVATGGDANGVTVSGVTASAPTSSASTHAIYRYLPLLVICRSFSEKFLVFF